MNQFPIIIYCQASKLVGLMALLIPALSLLTSWSTSVGLGVLVILGLLGGAVDVRVRRGFPELMWAIFSFATVWGPLGVVRAESWGYFHLSIYLYLTIFVVWAFRMNPGAVRLAAWGAFFGVVLVFLKSIDSIGMTLARESGVMNPIPYGGIGLILAVVALTLCLDVSGKVSRGKWFYLGIVGFISGVGVSILSGSKAGWISLVLVPVGLMIFYWGDIYRGLKYYVIFGLLFFMCLVGFALYILPVGGRIMEAWNGLFIFLQDGRLTENSVGPRLLLWKFGLHTFSDNLIFGVGRDGMIKLLHSGADAGLYDPFLKTLFTVHNEFLNVAVVCGLTGLLPLLWVYAAMFRQARDSGNPVNRSDDWSFTVSRYILVSLALIFISLGVGEVAIQLSDLRNNYIFWMALVVSVFAADGLGSGLDVVEKT